MQPLRQAIQASQQTQQRIHCDIYDDFSIADVLAELVDYDVDLVKDMGNGCQLLGAADEQHPAFHVDLYFFFG